MNGLLTTREAAKLLNINKKTMERYCREGLIPTVKLPSGYYRIKREDLERFLQGGKK